MCCRCCSSKAVSRVGNLAEFNLFVARIALASFMAYLVGQFMDVVVFNRLRLLKAWWAAPAASTLFGNLVDTIAFFSIAFLAQHGSFMAEHWVEIATVDYVFKLLISLGLFVPLYGVLLRYLSRKLVGRPGWPACKRPHDKPDENDHPGVVFFALLQIRLAQLNENDYC